MCVFVLVLDVHLKVCTTLAARGCKLTTEEQTVSFSSRIHCLYIYSDRMSLCACVFIMIDFLLGLVTEQIVEDCTVLSTDYSFYNWIGTYATGYIH